MRTDALSTVLTAVRVAVAIDHAYDGYRALERIKGGQVTDMPLVTELRCIWQDLAPHVGMGAQDCWCVAVRSDTIGFRMIGTGAYGV